MEVKEREQASEVKKGLEEGFLQPIQNSFLRLQDQVNDSLFFASYNEQFSSEEVSKRAAKGGVFSDYPGDDSDVILAVRTHRGVLDPSKMREMERSLREKLKRLRQRYILCQKALDIDRKGYEQELTDSEVAAQRAMVLEICLETRRRLQAKFVTFLRVLKSLEYRKKPGGFSEETTLTLRLWLFEHFSDPYPSKSEKELLMEQTGLSSRQLENWFINMRVRVCNPLQKSLQPFKFPSRDVSIKEDTSEAVDVSEPTSMPAEQGAPQENLETMDIDEGTWIENCNELFS
ncbi:hypothetical protein NDN08_007474 [Rhodosorus marinus]|uniref:Homeobox domain-containing protein n=1 Tax=Rhodosorus marinus TaxID=101924 RepID=A0AAV8UYY1_9RHOD|nr:hypothetical protein NDN08_007474 [Rhodosorus marinus]